MHWLYSFGLFSFGRGPAESFCQRRLGGSTRTRPEVSCCKNPALRLVIVLLLAALISPAQQVRSVTFAWDPGTTPGIAGYRLYYGPASRSYPDMIDLGNTTVATISGLASGATLYFAVTCYSTNGLESGFSDEISYTMPLSPINVPTAGLVCYWKLDDGSGSTALDSSGSGNNGKLLNNPTWTAAKINGGLLFNGINNSLSTPAINLSATRAVSVSLWVNRIYSNTGGHALFESSPDSNNSTTGFMLFPDDSSSCSGGGLLVGLRGNAGYNLKCYAQPTSGVWHHLVAVFNKSQSALNEVSLYVDGLLQTAQHQAASNNNTNNFGSNALYFMSRGGSGDFSSGIIDDVRVYNRALSSIEVQQLYSLGTVLSKQTLLTKQVAIGSTANSTTPSITAPSSRNGLFSFEVVGQDGASYAIEVSSDGQSWTPVDHVVITGGKASVGKPIGAGHQFYRAKLLP